VERQAEDRLAGRPHDVADAQLPRGREHVVRADRVVAEQLGAGHHPGSGHRTEVDHRVHTLVPVIHLVQDLHGLAHVGEVSADERARVIRRPDQVHVGHRVAVRQQVGQADPAQLAAATGQHHMCHLRDP
jgi:hypothetical protein